MWFEVLPPICVIGTLIALPQFFAWHWNQAIFGNHFRRELHETWDRHQFTRDTRLAGGPWNIQGIEAIPDGE